jgi:hypothetical protein
VLDALQRAQDTKERQWFRNQYPGSTDVIRLGNVYFNRTRTFAIMLISSYCGTTCGRNTMGLYGKKMTEVGKG